MTMKSSEMISKPVSDAGLPRRSVPSMIVLTLVTGGFFVPYWFAVTQPLLSSLVEDGPLGRFGRRPILGIALLIGLTLGLGVAASVNSRNQDDYVAALRNPSDASSALMADAKAEADRRNEGTTSMFGALRSSPEDVLARRLRESRDLEQWLLAGRLLVLLMTTGLTLWVAFQMQGTLQAVYDDLDLSGAMVLFFSIFYLQHVINRLPVVSPARTMDG